MAMHIDLVENDWSGAAQIRLVTVVEREKGHVELEHVTQGWGNLQTRLIRDQFGHRTTLDKNPEDAFDNLTYSYRGDYLFATAPHEESECPFNGSSTISMTSFARAK